MMGSRSQPVPAGRLALLTGAALATGLSYCALTTGLGQLPGTDYREYVTLGRTLVEHHAFANAFTPEESPPLLTAMFPPIYALFVWIVFAASGVESSTAIAILQGFNTLCTAMMVPLVWDILRRLDMADRWAWLGAMLTTVHPLLISITPRLWDTAAFALGVTLAVWMILRLTSRNSGEGTSGSVDVDRGESTDSALLNESSAPHSRLLSRSPAPAALGFGAYLGILAHLNPALTPCYPLMTLWLAWRWRRAYPSHRPGRRVFMAVTLYVSLAWAVVSLPWTLRNHQALGIWTYVRSGFWQEVWFGCCPQADDGLRAALDTHMPLRNADAKRKLIDLGEAEYVRVCARQSVSTIQADPLRYLKLCLWRASDYWLGTTFSHLGASSRVIPTSWTRRSVMLFLTGETLAMVIAVWLARRRSADVWWLAGIVVVFSLIYALTHVEVRYRAPIEPLIILVIVTGAARLFTTYDRSVFRIRRPTDNDMQAPDATAPAGLQRGPRRDEGTAVVHRLHDSSPDGAQ